MAKVDVFVLPTGQIQVFVNNATDEEAVEISKKVMEKLKISGLKFGSIEKPEFHKDGGDHVHVVNEVINEQNI
jgi:hypothetical protein